MYGINEINDSALKCLKNIDTVILGDVQSSYTIKVKYNLSINITQFVSWKGKGIYYSLQMGRKPRNLVLFYPESLILFSTS